MKRAFVKGEFHQKRSSLIYAYIVKTAGGPHMQQLYLDIAQIRHYFPMFSSILSLFEGNTIDYRHNPPRNLQKSICA